MLGLAAYSEGDFEKAEGHFSRSLELSYSPWGLACLGETYRAKGQRALGADFMASAARLRPFDFSLVKEALFMLAKRKAIHN